MLNWESQSKINSRYSDLHHGGYVTFCYFYDATFILDIHTLCGSYEVAINKDPIQLIFVSSQSFSFPASVPYMETRSIDLIICILGTKCKTMYK